MYASEMAEALSARIGVPMKQPPNTLAEVIYRFDDNITVRMVDVPVHHSKRTQRYTIHAVLSEQLHKRVTRLADILRRQRQRSGMRNIPLSVTSAQTDDFLRAA